MRNTAIHQQAPRLEWQLPLWCDEDHSVGMLVSACERYRIDRVGHTYTSWRRATLKSHLNLRLGEVEDIAAAKALCEADLPR